MKLLIVTPNFPPEAGGPARYTQELLAKLPLEGINVNVLSFSRSPSSLRKNVQLVSTLGSIFTRQSRFLVKLIPLVIRSDSVLILEPLVVGFTSALVGWIFDKKIVLKFVGDPSWEESRRTDNFQGDLYQYYNENRHKLDWRYWLTWVAIFLCNKVIVPSSHLASFLSKYYGCESKTTVIHNSVNIYRGTTKKEKGEIVFCGRLVTWKNVSLLLKSLSMLEPRIKFHLNIVGSGPELESLRKSVSVLKLQKKVTFYGNLSQEEAYRIIGKSEILVLPSDYEGLSHVILEAMSQKTLVIASDIPGNDELVSEESGYLVNQKSVASISNTIKSALESNRRKREKMAGVAYTMVKDEFSWEVNLQKLLRIIKDEN